MNKIHLQKNIETKIRSHLKYDEVKGLKSDRSVEKINKLWRVVFMLTALIPKGKKAGILLRG